MEIHPYLNFNGQCEAAFKFYEQCLGGRIEALLPFGETGAAEHVPPEWRNRIMHARLVVDGAVLMGSDAPTEQFEAPKGISVSLHFKETADADRVFNALAENGTVQMPIQETFWAARFGMCVDQYGIPWMVNCELPA